MRFLADESCDFAVVRALRGAGHDVTAIAGSHAALDDSSVLALARSENRILTDRRQRFRPTRVCGWKENGWRDSGRNGDSRLSPFSRFQGARWESWERLRPSACWRTRCMGRQPAILWCMRRRPCSWRWFCARVMCPRAGLARGPD
ncbi:MAG: DUF5615 family PIN-like protein [Acidobacteria bacterium]|nr:DUF5615 family PIN-like protein [Acidobacteriota bacterium]